MLHVARLVNTTMQSQENFTYLGEIVSFKKMLNDWLIPVKLKLSGASIDNKQLRELISLNQYWNMLEQPHISSSMSSQPQSNPTIANAIEGKRQHQESHAHTCLLYTSPSPRD